jgi:hypothetical protein
MKRYYINGRDYQDNTLDYVESPEGEWVKWDDVSKILQQSARDYNRVSDLLYKIRSDIEHWHSGADRLT